MRGASSGVKRVKEGRLIRALPAVGVRTGSVVYYASLTRKELGSVFFTSH